MIQGEVTSQREAVITIHVRGPNGVEVAVEAVIDTGFTEYLTLPPAIVAELGLPFDTSVPVSPGGDLSASFDVHVGSIEWDGVWREIEVLSAEGAPLIGMAMLRGFRLVVDGIDGGPVFIERL